MHWNIDGANDYYKGKWIETWQPWVDDLSPSVGVVAPLLHNGYERRVYLEIEAFTDTQWRFHLTENQQPLQPQYLHEHSNQI